MAAQETAVPATPNDLPSTQDTAGLFRSFVYKLAHVCDNTSGGTTMTAFTILRTVSGGVRYFFASNQRLPGELDATQEYVVRLLRLVNDSPPRSKITGLAEDEVLKAVLLFNQKRLTGYFRRLGFQARDCSDNASALESNNEELVTSSIRNFIESSQLETALPAEGSEFVNRIVELLRCVSILSKSPAGALIQEQARQGRMLGHKSQECWSEFQHTLSRIMAYIESVNFLRQAQKIWPVLFNRYEVVALPSSKPIPRPSRRKSETASAIVGRMTRKQEKMDLFRDYVASLQNFDLDERLRKEWRKDSFRPIVHAEIVLLDWLERNGGVMSQRFFNDWKYIGGSKPTCKLCHYYFELHDARVGHRSSHGNLYPSWRFPDVFEVQGEEGAKARQVMMRRVLDRIREDAFALVEQKVPASYKHHDSNTFSTMFTFQDRLTAEGKSIDGTRMDEIERLMKQTIIGNK
ncbi:hypothetical protein PFICI_14794 [Pestalotiopsis fici W106-1]|uniref:C2H2-type domain-containing protein n=1 Tax=Pestalotiopsis fici (strain W106-1 / CGMCC3.15140) TaxID=1229662 RepID=W3WIZ0_PESFW|nr:uncharacterized protein PFICI_14794 [Pestalotiopsis fici W106-1]ETS73848.1 hypothetical protein PFICI_14794 [Pestalotiopsis fici W106-1]